MSSFEEYIEDMVKSLSEPSENEDEVIWTVVAKHYLDKRRWADLYMWSFMAGEFTNDELLNTVFERRAKYGRKNILDHVAPVEAVVVRTRDKINRIDNMIANDMPQDDLEDSYLDICGYCLIALALDAGTF